jgi:pyridoxal 5'-phosphate synthase pdxT subunit
MVGVLALQGDFDAHLGHLALLGVEGIAIREASQLSDCDALILPGGESTTMIKLLVRYGMDTSLKDFHAEGKPIWGTCAGMILVAKSITEGAMRGGQSTLNLMDISVARNAFGRQIDSFEADLNVPQVSDTPLRAVFIRAPYITDCGENITILARVDDKIVLAEQPATSAGGRVLVSAFHPELTGDTRLLEYFLDSEKNVEK